MKRASLWVLAAIVGHPAVASAQRAHYENVIFGERASGMAGATIALADEPSAAFYNPAGLAQLDYDILGLSVQALGAVTTTGEGLVRIGDSESSTSSWSWGALPTSAAYTFPIGPRAGTFALSVVTPVIQRVGYSHGLRSPDGAVDLIAESSIEETEMLLGPSYALRAGPFCFGASLYLEYANVAFESLEAASAVDPAGGGHEFARTRRSEGTQVGVTGVFGALVRFDEHWSAGLRLRFPNLPLSSSSKHTLVESGSLDGSSSGQQTLQGVPGTMTYPHPFGLGLGLGYRARRLQVALDAKGYLPARQYELFGGELQQGAAGRPWDPTVTVPAGDLVANFALGVEVFVVEDVSLLFGVYTDSAATPSSAELAVAGATTMSFIGETTGVRVLSDAGTFTVSLGARHGQGKVDSLGWDDRLTRGDPGTVQQTSGMLTLSWARSLTSDWVALQKRLNSIVGRRPD